MANLRPLLGFSMGEPQPARRGKGLPSMGEVGGIMYGRGRALSRKVRTVMNGQAQVQ